VSRPLPPLAVLFWLGAWLADLEAVAEPLQLAALAAAALALGSCAIERAAPRAGFVALLAAAFAVGAAAGLAERRSFESDSLRRAIGEEAGPVQVVGRVVTDGRAISGEARVVVDVERLRTGRAEHAAAGRVALRIAAAPDRFALAAGQEFEAWARLWRPANSPQPGAFDLEGLYRRDGTHLSGAVKSARLVQATPGRRDLRTTLAAIRADARERIERHVRPGPATALTLAMVLGDRAALDDAVEEDFRRAGTFHVLALSGAQVAFVAAAIVLLAVRLGLGPWAQFALAAPTVTFYALLVGADVPVMRAAFGAAVALLGRALDQRADGLHLLAVALLAWLAGFPAQAGDLGCQLSFLATAGLVLLTRPLARGIPGGARPFGLALAGSLAAQWALLPLAVARFHRLAVMAPLLNLAAVPLATALLALGVAVWASDAAWPPLAAALGALTSACADLLLWSSRLAPVALDARLPAPATWAVALHFVGFGALALQPGRQRAALRVMALAGVGLVLARAPHPLGVLRLTALDVGHGDALLVELPHGERWMVDAGGAALPRGAANFGERVLGPLLWARGIGRIDGLVVTHAHPDHAGGAGFLRRAFGVREVIVGPWPPGDVRARRLAAELAGANLRAVVSGARLDWTGVTVDVLGPRRPRRAPIGVRNDDSVVLRVRFGRVCLLLTGDAESGAEATLRPGRCDVLKVGHHGSRTSSSAALLAATRPGIALVSAGRRDLFGHPHPEVLARLRAVRAQVLQTPLHGAIGVETDGSVLRVSASAPP
jgi:competence protein ComEC